MSRERENKCRGCAECISCGRKDQYFVNLICDVCGNEYNASLWNVDGKELCKECAKEAFWEGMNLDDYYARIDEEDEGDEW